MAETLRFLIEDAGGGGAGGQPPRTPPPVAPFFGHLPGMPLGAPVAPSKPAAEGQASPRDRSHMENASKGILDRVSSLIHFVTSETQGMFQPAIASMSQAFSGFQEFTRSFTPAPAAPQPSSQQSGRRGFLPAVTSVFRPSGSGVPPITLPPSGGGGGGGPPSTPTQMMPRSRGAGTDGASASGGSDFVGTALTAGAMSGNPIAAAAAASYHLVKSVAQINVALTQFRGEVSRATVAMDPDAIKEATAKWRESIPIIGTFARVFNEADRQSRANREQFEEVMRQGAGINARTAGTMAAFDLMDLQGRMARAEVQSEPMERWAKTRSAYMQLRKDRMVQDTEKELSDDIKKMLDELKELNFTERQIKEAMDKFGEANVSFFDQFVNQTVAGVMPNVEAQHNRDQEELRRIAEKDRQRPFNIPAFNRYF